MTRILNTGWTYRGLPVHRLGTAEIHPSYLNKDQNWPLVQQALDQDTTPWRKSVHLVTCLFRGIKILQEVVPVTNQSSVLWGIHRMHKLPQADYSPFIRIGSLPTSNLLAVTLGGTQDKPLIVGIMGVDPYEPYVPPLPWRREEKWFRDGKTAALNFWKSHAYALYSHKVMRQGTQRPDPPRWFFHVR